MKVMNNDDLMVYIGYICIWEIVFMIICGSIMGSLSFIFKIC